MGCQPREEGGTEQPRKGQGEMRCCKLPRRLALARSPPSPSPQQPEIAVPPTPTTPTPDSSSNSWNLRMLPYLEKKVFAGVIKLRISDETIRDYLSGP